MKNVNDITEIIVDACVCVHRKFGPGLLESVYEKILMVELQKRGLFVESQKSLPIVYEGTRFEDAYRIDLLVNKEIVVELKSTNVMHPVYHKQLKTYLALSGLQVGILANFGMATMKEGLKRIVHEYKGEKPTPDKNSASPRENKESVGFCCTRSGGEHGVGWHEDSSARGGDNMNLASTPDKISASSASPRETSKNVEEVAG